MRPYRASVEFCFSSEDMAAAEVIFDAVVMMIERCAGGLMQVGSLDQMDVADVVPESPLAQALT